MPKLLRSRTTLFASFSGKRRTTYYYDETFSISDTFLGGKAPKPPWFRFAEVLEKRAPFQEKD
jgi:hypothetical protein